MNELNICSYDQAVALKKAGFDWPCLASHYYDSDGNVNDFDGQIPAYSVAVALKWFRDVKNIPNGVQPQGVTPNNKYYEAWWISEYGDNSLVKDTYENAESALLDELLKLIESNGQKINI
jgi:hypothetical protein